MLLTPRIIRTHELRASDLSPIYIGTQSNMALTGPPPVIGGATRTGAASSSRGGGGTGRRRTRQASSRPSSRYSRLARGPSR